MRKPQRQPRPLSFSQGDTLERSMHTQHLECYSSPMSALQAGARRMPETHLQRLEERLAEGVGRAREGQVDVAALRERRVRRLDRRVRKAPRLPHTSARVTSQDTASKQPACCALQSGHANGVLCTSVHAGATSFAAASGLEHAWQHHASTDVNLRLMLLLMQ